MFMEILKTKALNGFTTVRDREDTREQCAICPVS